MFSAYCQRLAICSTDKCKCFGLWPPAPQASACCKATQVIRQNRAGAHGIDPGFRARIICQCGDIAGGKYVFDPFDPKYLQAGKDFEKRELRPGLTLYHAPNPINDLGVIEMFM